MEVILKSEVAKLGGRGDLVRVSDGYARNYLLPRKLAIPATASSKKAIEQMKAAALRREAKLKSDAEQLAGLMKDLTVTVAEKAGENDQLFGSVTSKTIAEELAKQGYTIDRHRVEIAQPIRMLGEHQVTLNLHHGVSTLIKVVVVKVE
ncbi:MAG: 50S ribosomal protein L9 [Acidobacteria bacterium]|nr:50S ribosomal protein L9 [Acidobacteriota bacterium]